MTFANANATNTIATFSQPGVYQLQLTANDGQYSTSSNVTITNITSDAINYGSMGYKYIYPLYTNGVWVNNDLSQVSAANTHFPNFYLTTFDDSGWTDGQGGFGYDNHCLQLNGSGLSNVINTPWPGQSVATYSNANIYYPFLYLRRHFNVPAGTIAINNNIGTYWR